MNANEGEYHERTHNRSCSDDGCRDGDSTDCEFRQPQSGRPAARMDRHPNRQRPGEMVHRERRHGAQQAEREDFSWLCHTGASSAARSWSMGQSEPLAVDPFSQLVWVTTLTPMRVITHC